MTRGTRRFARGCGSLQLVLLLLAAVLAIAPAAYGHGGLGAHDETTCGAHLTDEFVKERVARAETTRRATLAAGASPWGKSDAFRAAQRRSLQQLNPRNISIVVDYQLTVFGAKAKFLQEKLVPSALAVVKSFISVNAPVVGALTLTPLCDVAWAQDGSCRQLEARDPGTCFTAKIPSYMYGPAFECPNVPLAVDVNRPAADQTCRLVSGGSGATTASGQPVDLFLMVTTATRSSQNVPLCQGSVIAAAAPCGHSDPTTGRPLDAVVNFCPDAIQISEIAFGYMLDTLVHEVLHALGFSEALYSSWLKDPLTNTRYKHDPTAATDQTKNEVISQDANGRWWLITPRAVEATRRQFGCATAIGAPLEENGLAGTRRAHLEDYVFFNELMSGSARLASAQTLSMVTLAIMEDTGWYTTGWRSPLVYNPFGARTGCSLLDRPCTDLSDSTIAALFCAKQFTKKAVCPITAKSADACPDSEKNNVVETEAMQCQFDRLGAGFCNAMALAPGCSVVAPNPTMQCRFVDNAFKVDWQGNTVVKPEVLNFGEYYGNNSRCINHDVASGEAIARQGEAMFPVGAGCYAVQCPNPLSPNLLNVLLYGTAVPCQPLAFSSMKPAGFEQGRFDRCLANAQICDQLECPSDCNNNGRCVRGSCFCNVGYFGTDCGQFRDPAALSRQYEEDTSAPATTPPPATTPSIPTLPPDPTLSPEAQSDLKTAFALMVDMRMYGRGVADLAVRDQQKLEQRIRDALSRPARVDVKDITIFTRFSTAGEVLPITARRRAQGTNATASPANATLPPNTNLNATNINLLPATPAPVDPSTAADVGSDPTRIVGGSFNVTALQPHFVDITASIYYPGLRKLTADEIAEGEREDATDADDAANQAPQLQRIDAASTVQFQVNGEFVSFRNTYREVEVIKSTIEAFGDSIVVSEEVLGAAVNQTTIVKAYVVTTQAKRGQVATAMGGAAAHGAAAALAVLAALVALLI
ncbi:unnamed protein product [Pedinophyceae sp. YPF-701]|nr:unnamed protein product [Pedinophyceae sp. YPF-701]